MTKGHREHLGSRNAFCLACGGDYMTVCMCHRVVHLKMENFTVCKWYLNKSNFFKKGGFSEVSAECLACLVWSLHSGCPELQGLCARVSSGTPFSSQLPAALICQTLQSHPVHCSLVFTQTLNRAPLQMSESSFPAQPSPLWNPTRSSHLGGPKLQSLPALAHAATTLRALLPCAVIRKRPNDLWAESQGEAGTPSCVSSTVTALPWHLCLKTVASYNLSSFLVVYGGKVSLLSVTVLWLDPVVPAELWEFKVGFTPPISSMLISISSMLRRLERSPEYPSHAQSTCFGLCAPLTPKTLTPTLPPPTHPAASTWTPRKSSLALILGPGGSVCAHGSQAST